MMVPRLRGRLLNTFCVKLNVPMECDQSEENCQTIGNFNLPQTETASQVGGKHICAVGFIFSAKCTRCSNDLESQFLY